MKQLFKVVSLIAFVIATPIFLLLLSVRLSGFSAPYLKEKLARADIYSKAITDINKILETPIGGITPGYVKGKTEKLIDDTEAWVKGKKDTPPDISFSDLNPQAFAEIKNLASQYQGEQELSIDTLIKNDFSFPLGEQLLFVKNLYLKVVYGLPFAALVIALSLAGILFLSETNERFRWLGTAFLLAAFWTFLPLGVSFFGLRVAEGLLAAKTGQLPTVAKPLFEMLVTPIANKFVSIGAASLLLYLVLAIAAFVFGKRKTSRKVK